MVGQEEILQQERNKIARIMMIEDDAGMRFLPAGFLITKIEVKRSGIAVAPSFIIIP